MSDLRPLFQALGFVINTEKSSWVPSQIIDWFGFRIDLVKGMFSVPPEKLDALKAVMKHVKESPRVGNSKAIS